MKTYIKTLVAVTAGFLLSACGGGGSGTSTGTDLRTDKAVSLAEAGNIVYSEPNYRSLSRTTPSGNYRYFRTSVKYQKNVNDNYTVKIVNESIVIEGCRVYDVSFDPNPLLMSGNIGSIGTVNISGTVEANCTNQSRYSVVGRSYVTLDGKTVEEPFSFSSQENGQPEGTGYSFFNLNSPLLISKSGTEYDIRVQLLYDKKVAPGRVVEILPFDDKFGTIKESYRAVTGGDGYAHFLYCAPSSIASLDGVSTTIELTFTDENNITITTPFELTFKDTGDLPSMPVDTTGMQIYPVPDIVSISRTNESRTIGIFVAKNGKPEANVTVDALFFDPKYGKLNTYSSVTDERGEAAFVYLSPESLPPNDINVTFRIANGSPVLEKQVEIRFGNSSQPIVNTSNMTLIPSPTQLAVASGSDSKTVSVYVFDTVKKKPVEGVVLKVDPINPNTQGVMNTYTATTNANGQAVFNYTAPSVLPSDDINLTFSFDNATDPKPQNVTVQFGVSSAPVDTTDIELKAVPSYITVAEGGESKVLSLFAWDDGKKSPVNNMVIKADFFDPVNGTLNTYSAVTNDGGQAVFNYTAPTTLPAGEANITFGFDNATDAKKLQVTVQFGVPTSPIDTTNMSLNLTPKSLNITPISGAQTIVVYASRDGDVLENIPLSADFFPTEYGTLENYSAVTDQNGRAIFVYTPPAVLPADDVNITFSVDGGSPELSVKLPVTFETVRYALYPDAVVDVSTPDTDYTIRVAMSQIGDDGSKTAAAGKTVVAEFLMPNFGTIAQYESVVGEDGIATFLYHSPQSLQNLNDVNVTFYNKDNRAEQNVTTLHFQTEGTSEVDKLYVVPSEFTVTEGGEVKELKIVTVNQDNIGVSSTAILEQPVLDGVDYGSFDKTEVTTDARGVGTVIYTAPDSISSLDERNITVTDEATGLKQTIHIRYDSGTTNGTDYDIDVKVPDSIEVDQKGQIVITIHERGNIDNLIDEDNVLEVNATMMFPNILTFENDETLSTYSGSSVKNIRVQAHTVAGVAGVRISALIYNGKQNVVITKEMPVTVLSGPVASISIYFVGFDAEVGNDNILKYFVNYYNIHAVDKYSNPAQKGVPIYVTLVNDVKVNHTQPLYSSSGSIKSSTTPSSFEDTSEDFTAKGVTSEEDHLIVLPNSDHYGADYLGGWTIIDPVTSTTFDLNETYTGPDTSDLSYVVGNERRYIDGSYRTVAVADIKSLDGTYYTDENGSVHMEVSFDPVLAGHTVSIGAHSDDGNRTGTSKVFQLRWGFYNATTAKIPNDGNTYAVDLTLGISTPDKDPIEKLYFLNIVPTSITSSSAQCHVDWNNPGNLYTGGNGTITVNIKTENSDPNVKECEISWNKSNSGIYLEY